MKSLIRHGLREGAADLETLPDGSICGHVISPEFRGRTYAQRRKRVGALLTEGLSATENRRVGLLLTYTPEEWSVPLARSG